MKNNIIRLLIVLLVSIFFFQDFLFYDKLPITSGDPAIKFWNHDRNANYLESGIMPLWDNTSSAGRSVFASDIFASGFSAVALFISLFDDHVTAYVFHLWLEFILFGLIITYYLQRWCQLGFTTALISFVIFMFCTAFLNEYFFNNFGGYLFLPLMLEQVDKYLLRRSTIDAVWLGCLLALSHWISNISVSQYSAIFVTFYLMYSIWDRKSIVRSFGAAVCFMLIAGFVWMGLMAFYIAPFLGEILNSYRSHISSVAGGFSIKDIGLFFLFPFTSGLFMDERMIPTGLLTQFESMGGYIHILLLPSIIIFLGNRQIFSRRERFFFYYVIGFMFLGWLNNYVPLLGYFQRITKGTGWWRSYPLCILMASFCVGIVISKINRHEILWNSRRFNRILRAFLKAFSLGYGFAFAVLILFLIMSSVNPDWLFGLFSNFTVRPSSHVQSYFEHYYFVWPRVLYIALIPATLALSLALFIKQTKEPSHGAYGGRLVVSLFLIILVGQYSLTQIYYPFNSGIHKTQELKEAEIFSHLGPDDRIGIVFNGLDEVEEKVREEIGYTDKDASLRLSLAMQAYPEVTRFQSNITMYGGFISSLGPAVYTRGSNVTSRRLVTYHDRLLKKDAKFREYFKRIKAYLRIGKSSIGSKLLDVAGINHIISSLPLLEEKLVLVEHGDSYYVYRNGKAAPKFYFARGIKTIRDKGEILNKLESNHFAPGIDVIVEEQLDIWPKENESGNANVMEYFPGRIKLLVENAEPNLLVINESYHPGWKAFSGGQELKIIRANYLFMGLALRAGKHDVELRFRPPAFGLGILISSLTLGLILFIAIANIQRRKKHKRGERAS